MKKVILSIALTGLFAVAAVNTVKAVNNNNTVLCEDGKDGKKCDKKKSCCKKSDDKKSCCSKSGEKKSCSKSTEKKTSEE
jgi:uncharacterized protein YxeA